MTTFFIRCCIVGVLLAFAAPVQARQQVPPPPPPAAPVATPAATPERCVPSKKAFELPGGSLGFVCVPTEGWTGDVIVFAHGYVDPANPNRVFDNLDLPQPGSSMLSLPEFAQRFGYAFAATTYRRNGLVVQEGVGDIGELVAALPAKLGRAPKRVFLLGFSEGGQIATLFVERNPLASDGLLAACAPIGSFQRQIQYLGDFRLLFNYHFPGVLPSDPSDPVTIPAELIANWQSVYVPKVQKALADDPDAAAKLVAEAGAAIDPNNTSTIVATMINVLYYNVISTNDSRIRLGGNAYSSAGLQARFPDRPFPQIAADASATTALAAYETSGQVAVPLLTAHTSGDDVVPVWQQQLYKDKTEGNGLVTHKTYPAYGHCAFNANQLFGAFTELARQGGNLQRLFLPTTQ